MAEGALGTAFSLLLLTSVTQGLQDVELFHYETMEAVVGQNIDLPCTVKNITNLRIVNIEWSTRGNEIKKLAMYTPGHGVYKFRSNVSVRIVNNDANHLMGSYLQLHKVEKQDGGIYICDVTTFPFGSIKAETELTIKDPELSTTWTMGAGDNNPKSSNVTITASVTSSPALHTDPSNFHIPTARNDIRTEESSTLGNSAANSEKPAATPTLSTGNRTEAVGVNDTVRSHLLLRFIIVPVLVGLLITVAYIHWRRQVIKQDGCI